MQVGEQNVDPPAALQVDAERPDAGAGVEDQRFAPASVTWTQDVLPP